MRIQPWVTSAESEVYPKAQEGLRQQKLGSRENGSWLAARQRPQTQGGEARGLKMDQQ